jgi:hypothetical protein
MNGLDITGIIIGFVITIIISNAINLKKHINNKYKNTTNAELSSKYRNAMNSLNLNINPLEYSKKLRREKANNYFKSQSRPLREMFTYIATEENGTRITNGELNKRLNKKPGSRKYKTLKSNRATNRQHRNSELASSVMYPGVYKSLGYKSRMEG